MKKTEQIDLLAQQIVANLSHDVSETKMKKTISDAIKVLETAIHKSLKSGEKVDLLGFGIIRAKDTPARVGRNPHTGEPVKIPAKKRVSIRPGKSLKLAVA